MKKIILFIITCCCLMGCSTVPQAYVLRNTESGDKITLGNVTSPEDFQLIMGKAQKIEREPDANVEGASP